jgi:hypothetical protein
MQKVEGSIPFGSTSVPFPSCVFSVPGLRTRANRAGIPLTMCVMERCSSGSSSVSPQPHVESALHSVLEIEVIETSRVMGVYALSHDAPAPHFNAPLHP